jgi:hypothetical protein
MDKSTYCSIVGCREYANDTMGTPGVQIEVPIAGALGFDLGPEGDLKIRINPCLKHLAILAERGFVGPSGSIPRYGPIGGPFPRRVLTPVGEVTVCQACGGPLFLEFPSGMSGITMRCHCLVKR